MGDWPAAAGALAPTRQLITTISIDCSAFNIFKVTGGASLTTAWQVANTGVIIPMNLSRPFPLKQLAVENGATVSGAFDITWWDRALTTKLVSTGSVTQTGVSALQIVDVADTTIPAGDSFVTFVLDNVTGLMRLFVANGARALHLAGIRQFAGAVPVGASITPAVAATVSNIPFIAFASGTVL